MTGAELLYDIRFSFGGVTVSAGYFSEADVDHAIGRAIDHVLQNMSVNADQGTYSTQTVTGDGTTESFALSSNVLRPLHVFDSANGEVQYLKMHDFQIVKSITTDESNDPTISGEVPYCAIAGGYIYFYPVLPSGVTATISYIPEYAAGGGNPEDQISVVPKCYHEAASAYAQVLLGRKAAGIWNGDQTILWAKYKTALDNGHSLANEGFRNASYPMRPQSFEIEDL